MIFFAGILCAVVHGMYTEEMVMKPLSTGHVYTHFHFRQSPPPPTIAHLVEQYGIDELHLSFAQGRWNPQWGPPIRASPVGAELVLYLARPENGTDLAQRWSAATHALGGMTCASLQFMDETVATSPAHAYAATGAASAGNQAILRALLPRELVCTENLTPWRKLLPCESAGLAHLLAPLELYASSHVAQTMHVRRGEDGVLELVQSISVVQETASRDWSLMSLFDGRVPHRCDVADEANLYVLLDGSESDLSPQPDRTLTVDAFRLGPVAKGVKSVAQYTLPTYSLVRRDAEGSPMPKPALAALHQVFADPSIDHKVTRRGAVQVWRRATSDNWLHFEFKRHDTSTEPLAFVWFDTPPWQMRMYLHTLKCEGAQHTVSFAPAEQRSTPNVMEIRGTLQPNESLRCYIQFERAFMHWTEFPPDAHRGYDMGAGVLELWENPAAATDFWHWSPVLAKGAPATTAANAVRRVYSGGLQIIMPTPDFSMPYNVICLSGTVWALYFGNVYNILIRRFGLLRQGKEFVSDRPIPRLIRFLKATFARLREKGVKTEKTD